MVSSMHSSDFREKFKMASKWPIFINATKNNETPTWLEFLASVTDEASIKTGLTSPLYSSCDICNAKYSKIIKMETFDEDIGRILSMKGFAWLSSSHLNSYSKPNFKLNVTELLQDVPTTIIRKIYERYEVDFIQCGYEETLKELDNLIRYHV